MEKLVVIGREMDFGAPRRFVRVARPPLHAGVGTALRQAFDMNGAARDLTPFDDLLARLN